MRQSGKNSGLKFTLTVSVIFVAGLAVLVQGYTASSTNYILQSDSVNFGGGFSTSTSYSLQDTLGEIGTGILASSTAILSGGYQAMFSDVYISMTAPASVAMSPAISGIAGGVSNGSSTWEVHTDNPVGYEMSIHATGSPALSSGSNSFADYVPSYPEPDYNWTTGTSESRFGFTPEGSDIVSGFLDDGVSCGTGVLNTTDKCWTGFSLTDKLVSRSNSANSPVGASTTIKFRAEAGATKAQPEGNYSATVVVTAVTL